MDDISASIWISKQHLDEMRKHVEANLPEEACGLVAGKEGRSQRVYLVENILHSPIRYRMNPEGQLKAFIELEQNGWELLAIFHSHPRGPEHPSATDTDEAYYPEAAHLIWSYTDGEWRCLAFRIVEQKIAKVVVNLY